jgi:hypothetical protein
MRRERGIGRESLADAKLRESNKRAAIEAAKEKSKAKHAAATPAGVLENLLLGSTFEQTVGSSTIVVNASKAKRFPLPLTVGSAAVLALGALMLMRGNRVIGLSMLALGGAGIGMSAAAPEVLEALQ